MPIFLVYYRNVSIIWSDPSFLQYFSQFHLIFNKGHARDIFFYGTLHCIQRTSKTYNFVRESHFLIFSIRSTGLWSIFTSLSFFRILIKSFYRDKITRYEYSYFSILLSKIRKTILLRFITHPRFTALPITTGRI